DGLNALAAMRDFHRDLRGQVILTPHPGEHGRLAKALGMKADPVDQTKREAAARELAQRLGCVVVLKGHRTVISDGQESFVNETGNVALASGGTGDVLTGVIAGFVAQFFRGAQSKLSLLECARLAVCVHGLAADHWAQRHGNAGMLATDLLAGIPDAMKHVRG
ncbi:MAG: NAD(P)H-hydrate dehydratase, partial [Phycisphaerales bacterium]|nr:NAD(P)H-hydrate dehydratase [Phycisphaerales bacterium]